MYRVEDGLLWLEKDGVSAGRGFSWQTKLDVDSARYKRLGYLLTFMIEWLTVLFNDLPALP